MKGEKIISNKKVFKVMGYIFFIVGVIEFILSLFTNTNYWLSVLQHLSIGIALLIDTHEIENKIVNILALPLALVCIGCIIVEHVIQ